MSLQTTFLKFNIITFLYFLHKQHYKGFLPRPGRETEYCDQFVCLSVCPRAYFWNRLTDLRPILCRSPVAVARSFSVLSVLLMTSRLVVVGRMAMRG